jgi:hypothetical protein
MLLDKETHRVATAMGKLMLPFYGLAGVADGGIEKTEADYHTWVPEFDSRASCLQIRSLKPFRRSPRKTMQRLTLGRPDKSWLDKLNDHASQLMSSRMQNIPLGVSSLGRSITNSLSSSTCTFYW